MASRNQPPRSRSSRIRVRVEPRRPLDLKRLARAVIELALREHEAEQQKPEVSQGRQQDEGDAA